MVYKIIDHLENKDCDESTLYKIWKILYNDWEDCPDDKKEATRFIIDEIVNTSVNRIKKIYKILFNDEEDDD